MERFEAEVTGYILRYKEMVTAIFKASAQDVFEEAQRPRGSGGRMPVVTGFLRNSFVAGLNGSTALTGPAAYELAILTAELGDTVTGGWTAAYALRREMGFTGADSLGRQYNEGGAFFARSAAENWQQYVTNNASRAGSGLL